MYLDFETPRPLNVPVHEECLATVQQTRKLSNKGLAENWKDLPDAVGAMLLLQDESSPSVTCSLGPKAAVSSIRLCHPPHLILLHQPFRF